MGSLHYADICWQGKCEEGGGSELCCQQIEYIIETGSKHFLELGSDD